MRKDGIKVVVDFSDEIDHDIQASSMMKLEIMLRDMTGKDVRVTKKLMGDDSKLRSVMTISQRNKL